MKKWILAVVAILLSGALSFADRESESKAVLELCNQWDAAYIKKDPTSLEKILTTDYVGIDHEGATTSKSDEINLIKSGDYVIFSVEHLEAQKVRIYAGAAIVTSLARVKQSDKGKISTIVGRATTVCVKADGQWRVTSWHASRLKQ